MANRLLDRLEVVTDNGDVVTLRQAIRDHCERQCISEVLEAAETGPVTLEVAAARALRRSSTTGRSSAKTLQPG